MQKDSDPRIVTVSGPQTIREVAETRTLILDAFRQGGSPPPQDFVLDCTSVTGVDLCFLQLIIATSRSAHGAGNGFSLRLPRDGAMLATLTRGGFIEGSDTRIAADPEQWCGRSTAAGMQK